MSELPRRINPRPCTEAEEIGNWSLLAETFSTVINNTNNVATPLNSWPFVRFRLNEAFGATLGAGLAGADVLDNAGADTNVDIVVYDVEGRYGTAVTDDKGYGSIYGDTPVYEALVVGGAGGTSVNPDDIFSAITIVDGAGASNYNAGTNTLTIVGTGGTDDKKVKVLSTDTTAEFLYDKVRSECQILVASMDTSADPLIKVAVDDTTAVNQNIWLRLDASAIGGYSVNAYQNLVNDNGTTKWDNVSDTAIVKISGQITARSGTTRGSGSAVAVSPFTLAEIGSPFTIYNLSGNTYEGGVSGGPLYCLVHSVDGEYFIDPSDLRHISSFANNKYLGAQTGLPNWRSFQTSTIVASAACVAGEPQFTITPATFVIQAS